MAKQKILNKKSINFLEKYLNNAAPTGYEWDGQKIWMDYLKPYVDEFITDTYGTAVGVINPKAKYKDLYNLKLHEVKNDLLNGCNFLKAAFLEECNRKELFD